MKKENKKKITYCKRCGSELDIDKKCTGCQKQYFKFNIRFFSLVTTFLCLFFIILLELYFLYSQKNEIAKIENNYKEKEQILSTKNNEMLETLQKYIQYGLDTSDELLFWHEHAVIVSNDGTKKYHNYGCEDLMLNSFWIYNTEAAEGDGYTMCKKCYEKENNPSASSLVPFGLGIDKIKYLDNATSYKN